MRKHLSGTKRYGGHELSDTEARRVAADVFAGRPVHVGGDTPVLSGSDTPQGLRVPNGEADGPHCRFLVDLFGSMVRNRDIPKYQLERRVDAFIAEFLPDICGAMLGWGAEVVVPEFPLKKPGSNQSTNVDYLLFRRFRRDGRAEAWVFVELKTDARSVRRKQIDTYRRAMERGMASLIADVEAIAAATKQRAKYAALLHRMEPYPTDRPIELLYLSPAGIDESLLGPGAQSLAFADMLGVEVEAHNEAWHLFRDLVVRAIAGA